MPSKQEVRLRGRPPGRSAKSRAELVEAAGETFRRLGYQRARMDDIAESLGITKSSLYYYVGSKEELLVDIILPPYRDAVTHLDAILASDKAAPDQLREVIARHITNVAQFYPAISVYVENLSTLPVPPEMRRLDAAYVRGLRRLLLDGMRAGTLRVADPAIAVIAVLGTLNWFALRYTPDSEWDLAQVIDEICAIHLNGLAVSRRRGTH